MSRTRLEVQQCVLCHTARRYGPGPTWDLLGIDYTQRLPPDAEFPFHLPRADLFVRFLVTNGGPVEMAVRVWWLYPDGTNCGRMHDYRSTVAFPAGTVTHEHPFRLVNIPLRGEGLYTVRVCQRKRHRWKGPRWRVLGADYFHVVR